MFSIDNINLEQQYEKSFRDLLNSPRSLEACKRIGIVPEDLDLVPEQQVRE